ncbi:protein ECERIFERUM 26-like [Euphorbia lathyris]|uniref:protein ECERIFERUM 26-like n=1 Tax=Euphorbia lathyris TaxID=212925 RepID=UPI003313BBA7
MDDFTYTCKRTVVSSKPVQPGKSFPLSVLDRIMEPNHLRILYYYRTPGGRDVGETTKKLRESMSEMLTCFPIVTGRLVKDKKGKNWMIKCNDAGARMVEAKLNGSLDDWLDKVDSDKEFNLIYWKDMSHNPYFWSTFNIQITEFEEGGIAIGLSCFHLLADPSCATMFIKAWADITLGRKMMTPPLCHPLPSRRHGNNNSGHRSYTDLINYYKSTIETKNLVADARHTTISFRFTDPMVRACMTKARTIGLSATTPFQALAGLFWACISKIKGKRNGLIDMCIGLDMRKVLGLDEGFFGNCMVYNKVHSNSTGYDGAARAIEKEIEKIDNEGIMDLIEWLENNECRSSPLMSGCDLICSNLGGIDPYLATFEEGYDPLRVSYYVEPFAGVGHVLVLPSQSGGGVMSKVVMVTLPEMEVVKLCEDDLILSFSPTILMETKK